MENAVQSEMVERVARAIYIAWAGKEADVEEGWTDCVPEARAAIAAMREPTEAMNDAAGRLPVLCEHAMVDDDEAWRARIDAALA